MTWAKRLLAWLIVICFIGYLLATIVLDVGVLGAVLTVLAIAAIVWAGCTVIDDLIP